MFYGKWGGAGKVWGGGDLRADNGPVPGTRRLLVL
jgi:hypothetical protein